MGEIVNFDKFSRLPERYQRRAREIEARVREIDAVLKPTTVEAVGPLLKRLRGQLRPQPDTDTRQMTEGFLDACRDLPEWALSEAANDFLGGKVDNHTGQYMPACAEFAKRARHIIRPFLAERHALRVEASKLAERAEDEHRRNFIAKERADPAVRARVAAMVASINRGLTERTSPVHGGISEKSKAAMDKLRKRQPFQSKIGRKDA